MSKENGRPRRTSPKKVVNRGKGVLLGEVVENKRKINFKKCPI